MEAKRQHEFSFSKMNIYCMMFVFIVVIISFFSIVLSLPLATCDKKGADIVTAFYTTVSAFALCGSSFIDNSIYWSLFGKFVILVCMQIGAFVILTASNFLFLRVKQIFRVRILNLDHYIIWGNQRTMLKLLFYTLIYIISFELIGACLFLLVFTPIYGVKQGIVFSVFTSVSAFTNCGINILPTDIMTVLNSNVLYNIISFLLMFAGGLGFVPLVDIVANKSVKKISFVSKLSLFGMIVHTFIGCTLFCVFEWTNQGTIANLPIYSKLAISINATQSVRCAHLCSVNYQSLSSASKMLMLINILVGASPYSFSGGLYISTISAVIVFMYSYIKYNSSYTLFGLSFDAPVVKRAMFIILYTSTCIIFMTFILSMNENIDLIEILFEVFTVFTLSGTSLANVLNLSKVGKVLIAIITLIARFGTIFFVNKLNRKNGLNAKGTFKICNSNDLTV